MNINQNKLLITLLNDSNEDILYQVNQIFAIEGSEQLYCVAAPFIVADDNAASQVFLRCSLIEEGDSTEFTIADIEDQDEYIRVEAAFEAQNIIETLDDIHADLNENEDFITLTDVNGNEVEFICHLIFDDDTSNRSYIAMQEVDHDGIISEEIALYRLNEKNDSYEIETIPSDMEYERARDLFIKRIEGSAE